MCFTDDDLGDLNLSVTDTRFFDERHELLTGVVTHTATRLRRGQCVVGVGLGGHGLLSMVNRSGTGFR